jgi:tetracycline repressor-like protein
MFAGTYLTDNRAHQQQHAALRVFTQAGFTVADAAEALSTVYCFTIGFVIEEQAVYPRPGERSEQYDIDRRTERLAGDNVPLAVEAGKTVFADFDRRYRRGVQAIVTGVATWLAHPADSAG